MLVLELLGTLSLRNETPPVPVSAQQKKSLGLLAILALAGRQGFPRDRIEAYLWPESSASLAQHSLDGARAPAQSGLGPGRRLGIRGSDSRASVGRGGRTLQGDASRRISFYRQ